MREVVVRGHIIILGQQFDESQQVEGFANDPALRTGIEDGLAEEDELFDGVGEGGEF